MNDLRVYMSHAVLIALMERKGEDFNYLMKPMMKARKSLATSSRATLAAADKRITQAVAQLLDGAPAPTPATRANGLPALETDMVAEALVAEYRPRVTDWDRTDWRQPVADTLDRRAEALQRKAAKAREAKAAARAEELASRGVPFDADAPVDGAPPLRWLGAWRDDREYTPGSTTVHRDTLWAATTTCRGIEPGKEGTAADEPRAWRIVLKRPDLRPSARDRK
jgi:hypothetical protein